MECFLIAGESQLSARTGITDEEARSDIQTRFASKEGKGLRVFFPNPKGGNSNSGPTSRRFFENASITAQILDCPQACVSFQRQLYFVLVRARMQIVTVW